MISSHEHEEEQSLDEDYAHDEQDDGFLNTVMELSKNPQIDDALILRLTYDLATKLHSPDDIARRYSLADEAVLREYLLAHPEIIAEARKLSAIFRSDAAAEDRVRMKFLYAVEQLVLPMSHLARDPHTPLGARIDAFKQIQRGAGMDGLSSSQRAGQREGGGGQPFNLTINFAGGRVTGATYPVTISGITDATTSSANNADDESRATDELSVADGVFDATDDIADEDI